jgi:hypothetical protein
MYDKKLLAGIPIIQLMETDQEIVRSQDLTMMLLG